MSLILAYIFTLWSCWSKPLADSGAVQPRNQIKNQRENSWRTTFPENPALCHGCAGLLVFLSVSFTCLGTSHHPKNRKKTETDNLLRTKRWSSHQNMIHRLHNNDKNLFAEKLLQGDSWTSALPKDEINAKKSGLSSYSFTRRMSRFQKTSSASLSSVVAPPDHWIKIPSGLHAVAVLMRHVRYGQRTSPSCMCQRKQGKNHNRTTHRSVAHRTVGGMHTWQPGPNRPICKWPKQTAAVWRYGEQCEIWIPPKYHAASCPADNFLLWPTQFMALLAIHLQGCKCCVADLGGQITSTAWKCNSGTLLLQLQQVWQWDWKDKWLPRQARLSLDGGWHRTWEVRYWPSNVKTTIRKAELSWHSRPGSPWAYFGSTLVGVVIRSPSEKLLK